jgi:Rad3-related DNA helicase
MSSQDLLARLRERGLAAWQAEFVQSFVKDGASPHQVLLASPGTGKTHATAALVAELTRGGTKRVLVLVPAGLRLQWAHSLERAEPRIPVLFVDRKTYRELEAASPVGGSAWAQEGIYVISQDFGKTEQIASSFCTTNWDLVIFDEAHRLAAPLRSFLLDRLMNGRLVERLLLLLAVRTSAFDTWLSRFLDPSTLPGSMSMTQWSGPLKNWDGSVVDRPRIALQVVPYTRGPDEVEFLTHYQTILPALAEASSANQFIAQVLLQRASSSLFALEQSLQSLRHKLVSPEDQFGTNAEEPGSTPSDLEVNSEEPQPPSSQPSSIAVDKPAAAGLIDQVLASLENVTKDEKLNALTRLVRSIFDTSPEHPPRICVFSSYADSVAYVYMACKDAEFPSSKLTGSTSQSERREVLDQFNQNGGVLVATDAALQGFELANVPHVIYYDAPSDPRALEMRRGRFDRFDRSSPCTLYLFQDGSGTMFAESTATEMVTRSLRPEDGEAITRVVH